MIQKGEKMNKRMVIFLSLLVMVMLACNLSSSPTAQAPGNTPQGNGNQPVGTPPANPVNISEGLASLNSYRITITIISRGPTPEDSSTTVIETQRSQEQDSRYTHITQTTVKKGAENPNVSEYELYRIGNDQCSNSSGEWSWTSMAPNQAEMMDIMMKMLDFTPVIDNPTFVGVETVNGIQANHFSFKATGLGVESGAEVTANQGDYWLAVDGQYFVKYSLVMETVMDPQTDVLHMETLLDMNNINQPVNIAFPQACLDASLVTPTP
jgi:hypothetical protein